MEKARQHSAVIHNSRHILRQPKPAAILCKPAIGRSRAHRFATQRINDAAQGFECGSFLPSCATREQSTAECVTPREAKGRFVQWFKVSSHSRWQLSWLLSQYQAVRNVILGRRHPMLRPNRSWNTRASWTDFRIAPLSGGAHG